MGGISGVRMTRTFARWPGRARLPAPLAALFAGLLTGCAGGLVGPLLPVTNPATAATVTVFRDFSLPGFFVPMDLRIDDHWVFRLWLNQQYSFKLDPGEYLFDYTIGFNECRRLAYIKAGQNYYFRLRPNCVRFEGPP